MKNDFVIICALNFYSNRAVRGHNSNGYTAYPELFRYELYADCLYRYALTYLKIKRGKAF